MSFRSGRLRTMLVATLAVAGVALATAGIIASQAGGHADADTLAAESEADCCEMPTGRAALLAAAASADADSSAQDADATSGNAAPDRPQGDAPDGMVWVPGGTFTRGSDDAYPEESPAHEISVDGFWMDRHQVTNRQFAKFVEATGYETVAERPLDPEDFPGVPEEHLAAGSVVFASPEGDVELRGSVNQWWQWVPGASWRKPEGPGSSIDDRMDHPVVHVAYEDAEAYAEWVGKSLPTEAQWERAARGGLEGKRYVWGDEFTPGGEHMANTWQGRFPVENTEEDGYAGTAPVMSYPANGYGLYDMAGNVWEWTRDWYHPQTYRHTSGQHNPLGPARQQSFDPSEPGVPVRVMRGGSYLCAPNYCLRYRPSARSGTTPDTGTNHLGFRCVITPDDNDQS